MRAFFGILLGLCLLGVLLGEVRGATKQGSSGPRQRRSLPPGWTDIGSDFLSGNELLPLTFFLKNSNLDELKAVVDRVSNPKSPFYTEYLSQEALARLIAPSSEFLDLFFAWLRTSLGSQDYSIDTVSYQDVVRLVLPLSAAEELLKVKYSLFQHDSSSAIVIRSLGVAHQIPASIRDGLDLIVGVNDFPPPPRRRRSSSTAFEMDPSLAFVDPKNSNTSNGTIITSLSGRDQQVTINFISAVPASASPPATLFASFFSTVPTFVFKQTFQTTPTCSIEAPTLGGSKQWQCSAVFDSLPNYIPLKVTIEEMAATGSLAPSVTSDYPCTPTPNTLPQGARSLYSIPQGIRVTHPNATQSVVEFEQQYYSPDDLAAFFQVTGTAPCPVTIVGPNDASNPGAEAALDIEWICAIAVGAPSYFWSIAANSTVEIDHILTWLYQMGNTTNPPSVNSLSYGMAFQNVDVFLGSGYAERTDVELQKLAARGITAIVASGDTGAPDIGPLPMSVPTCGLHADWPSQSTYITSVGSTFATPLSDPICYMPGGPNCLQNTIGEVGVSVDAGMRWTTGGGFAITPRPPYQNVVVPQYLNNTAALPSGFSQNPLAAGRAYPDAAMLGNDLQCVVAGEFVPISGTSASAPIFAGVITLLNNDRLLAGKKPLGFLNPMLYQMAAESAGFNDVTVGNNRCGAYGFSPVCCPDGYGAAIGFDSVAGLGTLNYLAARDYVLSLP